MGDDLQPRCVECNGPGPLTGIGPQGHVTWLCVGCLEVTLAQLGEKLRKFRQARLN